MRRFLIALPLILTFFGRGTAVEGETVRDVPAADRTLEERFLDVLGKAKVPAKTVDGTPVKWAVALKSDLLPNVRVYKYWNRYPRSVIVDIDRKEIVEKFDDAVMTQWIQSAKVRCDTEQKAKALSEFYTQARHEPYSAEGLKSIVTASDNGFTAVCTYTRTTVWSPANVKVAGSKVAEYRLQCMVRRDGTFTSQGPEEVRVLSTFPRQ